MREYVDGLIGLTGIVCQVVFIVLKLTSNITWSWSWVMAPMWLWLTTVVALYALWLAVSLIHVYVENRARQRRLDDLARR